MTHSACIVGFEVQHTRGVRRVSPYRAFQSLLQGRDALHVLCRRAISLEQYICT